MNNPADVPLLTAAMASKWLDVPGNWPRFVLAVEEIATNLVITKSAAAEEADRARIVELEEKISVYNKASCCGNFVLQDSTLRRCSHDRLSQAPSAE